MYDFQSAIYTQVIWFKLKIVSAMSCLQEMSLMLVCLKKHEFEQARCPKEIEAFVACNKQHLVSSLLPWYLDCYLLLLLTV